MLLFSLTLFFLRSYIGFSIITTEIPEVSLNNVHFAKTIWRSLKEYYRKLKEDNDSLVYVLTGKEAGSFDLNKLVPNEVKKTNLMRITDRVSWVVARKISGNMTVREHESF